MLETGDVPGTSQYYTVLVTHQNTLSFPSKTAGLEVMSYVHLFAVQKTNSFTVESECGAYASHSQLKCSDKCNSILIFKIS